MKQFDLELAIQGHPLITRSGKKVLDFHYFEHVKDVDYPIAVFIENYGVTSHTKKGKLWTGGSWAEGDLFLDDSIPWTKPIVNTEPIKYKDRKILPIMKPMLVWDENESSATEAFVYAKELKNTEYSWAGGSSRDQWVAAGRWKNAKPIPETPEIEITVKINGKDAKLSDVSEETLLKLRQL